MLSMENFIVDAVGFMPVTARTRVGRYYGKMFLARSTNYWS